MTETDRQGGRVALDGGIATAIREADLCHLLVRADGDAVAAAPMLAAGCDAAGTPSLSLLHI